MKQFFFIDCNDFFPTLLVQWRYHVVKNSGLFSEFLTDFKPRETLNYWSVEKAGQVFSYKQSMSFQEKQ